MVELKELKMWTRTFWWRKDALLMGYPSPLKRNVCNSFSHILRLKSQKGKYSLIKQYEGFLSCGNPPEVWLRLILGSDPSFKSLGFYRKCDCGVWCKDRMRCLRVSPQSTLSLCCCGYNDVNCSCGSKQGEYAIKKTRFGNVGCLYFSNDTVKRQK